MKGGGNMTEAELKKELKSGDFRRFYFIYGEDNYLKNHYAAQIAKKSAAVLPDMNYKKLDGEKTDFQTIYAQTEQLPCMADYRCVLVTDYNFASASDDEQTSVVDMISDLPESTVLVMLADTLEISPKKPGKWQKLIKAAEKHGGVLYFEHMSVSGLQNMLIKGAQKRKVMLDLSTAAYMVECCGREISKLQNELDKLCSHAGEDGRITKESIDALCVKSVDANRYQLSKYIFAGNIPAALKLINDLLYMRVAEIEISMLIIGGFIDAYRAKCAVAASVATKEAAEALGYKGREFVIENSARSANKIKAKTLRECIEILTENDLRMKSTGDDKRFLLEQTVLRVMRKLNSERL